MVDTPSGSSPTRPSARRSSRVKAVPRFRMGVASTEVPRARTRSSGPFGVLTNSYGRSVMPPPGHTPVAASSSRRSITRRLLAEPRQLLLAQPELVVDAWAGLYQGVDVSHPQRHRQLWRAADHDLGRCGLMVHPLEKRCMDTGCAPSRTGPGHDPRDTVPCRLAAGLGRASIAVRTCGR